MTKRWQKMVEKFGSEDAARAEMRRRAEKSSRNKNGVAYFKLLKETDPERLKEITSQGGKVKRNDNSSTTRQPISDYIDIPRRDTN